MAGKYYWYKLATVFFQKRFVRRLLKFDNGCDLVLAYLQIILLSLPDDCRIIFDDQDDTIEDQIAFDADISIDVIKTLWALMLEYGEAVQESEGVYLITEADSGTGSETASAERQRRSRKNRKRDNVTGMSHGVTTDCDNVTECHTACEQCPEESQTVTQSKRQSKSIEKESESDSELEREKEREGEKERELYIPQAPPASTAPQGPYCGAGRSGTDGPQSDSIQSVLKNVVPNKQQQQFDEIQRKQQEAADQANRDYVEKQRRKRQGY